MLLRCSCSSLESLCALQLSAQERDFVIKLLSGVVSRWACCQVVGQNGKSRPLGTRLPIASISLELLLVRVATLVRFEWRAFTVIEMRSRGRRSVVFRPKELMILGSSAPRKLLVLRSSVRGGHGGRVGETARAVGEKARLNRKVCGSERSHETAGVVKVERHVETLGPTDRLRELKLMQTRAEPSGEEILWGIVALELGTRGKLNSRILSSSTSELSLEVSFVSLNMDETSPMLIVEAIGLGLKGL